MIKDIIKNNRYPIVFIGSGISKRYLEDFPNWEELLKEYWVRIGEKGNFYAYLRSLKKEKANIEKTESEKDFYANVKTASYISEHFDNLFYEEKVKVDGLTIQEAYQQSISPFKFDLANRFKNYTVKKDMQSELKDFKSLLSKAKVIITTNYDTFIEDQLEEAGSKPSIYVGQNGFFDQTLDWCELYKIHGDISNPNSIVITESDYQTYDHNSILLSAKIIVNMIDSPIIFMGYSLSDRNIRELLNEFASQLPNEDIRKATNRIAIVEYKPNSIILEEEMMRDQELDISYLLISTNNYSLLFSEITKINEGLSPHEVLRYQKAIKNIVVAAGSKGRLDAVLISPDQMENLEKQIESGKNIVVALGNKKNIFIFPDIVSYMHDYLFEENEFLPAIALTFVSKDGNRKTKIPFVRYLNENDISALGLEEDVIMKINNKIDTTPTIDSMINGMSNYYTIHHDSLSEILSMDYNATRLINVIVYNIKHLDKLELTEYIKNTAYPQFTHAVKNKTNIKSDLRKLFYAYDIRVNGEPKKI